MTPITSPAKNEDVFSLSDEIVETMAAIRPISATFKGVPGHDGEWDDLSPAGSARARDTFQSYQRRLRALPPPEGEWAKLATLVMDDLIEQEIAQINEADPLLDMNSIQSSFQMLRIVFDCMDMSSRAGWEDVIRRLETIDRAAGGLREALSGHLARGRVVAARQARAGIEQARVHAGEGSFFMSLPARMASAGVTDAALVERLSAGVAKARGVFADLAGFLEGTYLPKASSTDGVGRERYLPHARRFLGMDLDPEETYAWGFEEVRSIWGEMQRVAGEILPGAPINAVIDLLKTDPSRSAQSPEELLRVVRERQSHALAALDGKHFDIPDALRRFEVRLAPKGGPLGAYYITPSEDLSRPGTIWYSLGDQTVVPLFDEITTAYHEGFPGHHLQCGLQVTLTDRLSRMHKLSDGYSGYAEGWALYAEQLMHELGFLEKPDYVLGMLAAQITRACRIVIDIGLHLDLPIPKGSIFHPGERWSFELATEMLRDVSFLAPDVAVSEVTRYLGWPGQAISYKVGQRVILGLRDELKRRRGPAFNLREFHAKVVGSGAVGLKLLRELIVAD